MYAGNKHCGVTTDVFVPVSLCVQELVPGGGVINSHVEKSLSVETFAAEVLKEGLPLDFENFHTCGLSTHADPGAYTQIHT